MVAQKKGRSTLKTTHFDFTLGRFKRRWRAGLLLVGALRALAWIGFALLAFGVLDFYSGFSDPARHLIANALSTLTAFGVAYALWDTCVFSQRGAAGQADRSLKSARREVLSALELGAAVPSQAPASASADAPSADAPSQAPAASPAEALGHWLRQRALDSAATSLDAMPFAAALPTRQLWTGAGRLLVVLAIVAACFGLAPAAARIIAQRLLEPSADIPPYSALTFVLGPHVAEVLYGGEILISAEISGAPVKESVRCLTRDPSTGKIEESPAFQENAGRYSRKLERVAAPLEIAFAVGHARSAWLPVAVRNQPKVQEVILSVTPPAYTGLPVREFALGTQELAALPGSQISARVLSNRPLSGGTLRLQSGTTPPENEVAAQKLGSHQVQFAWTAKTGGRLSIEVRDALGTRSEPLLLEQKLLRDARPEVALRQPAADVFATPETELPLEGVASDDLGLKRVTLVRQLKGYRERSIAEPISPGRNFEFAEKLKLAAFGLVPGQTLELMLESADTNPNLLGVSVSEPARVHIVSVEKYAAMLRAETTLEDFTGRYEALREAMETARKALDALEKAATDGDPAAAEEARKKALEAHQKAADLFGQIARDFPIFDLDSTLSKAVVEAMTPLFENGKQLKELWRARPEELLAALPELKKRLGESEKTMAPELEKGERVAAAAKVMEETNHFREVIEAQRDLVKDLNRALEQIRRGESKAGQALGDLAQRQKEIAGNLREMEKNIGGAVDALPEDFASMKADGEKFLQALRDLEIPPTMDEAAQAGEKADSKIASDRAGEALAKLEALLRKKNGICEMCRGEGDPKFLWPEELAQTLEQLMDALIPKPKGPGEKDGQPGQKPGMGQQGPGGNSDSGFSMRGKMPQLPIYGPSRSRFGQKGSAGLGRGDGSGKGNPDDGANVEKDELTNRAPRRTGGEAVAAETVPESYRDAVKRYFSGPDAK